ncbi:ribosomal protein S5 domain 2-type protein [Halteromyces radiatus]|uniref:ribosomal protein S5 domain 2-type protein n=1 Tax=Halteromyces radiatus TaxID=101107 RepID=UPI00221FBE7F|nr:ribosomal protein S5 domain 2-type protein [Halteromyces radiatus]KAI8086227.1 ribosomal protein S5 domain 2-type protein [Halteromyces radiatus]
MSSQQYDHVTIASAPGKVLLAGGYLVLDQQYTGLVIGTSARFYTIIHNNNIQGTINVFSPQFEQATWNYTVFSEQSQLNFIASETDSPNKFVQTCLQFTLTIILQLIGSNQFNNIVNKGMDISIIGDNDFYSQREELEKLGLSIKKASSREKLTPFCDTHATLGTVNKTGLGSSAALTTSLVAALFLYFDVFKNLDQEKDLTLVHNVAQYVHCFAQGKVGSGFDVSAAVYGSHRYQRFDPTILTPIMDENVDPIELTKSLSANNKSWDNKVVSIDMPPQFQMILADIDAGSHTPTLVSKVLKWRKDKPEEATALWNELGAYNTKVEQHFRELNLVAMHDSSTYNSTLARLAELPATKWIKNENGNKVEQLMMGLVTDFCKVRELLQKMSAATGVPIEPIEQTKLLDQCMEVPGTIMAGVPGAGGYDAIFCIVISEKAKQGVRQVWEQWSGCSVSPLLCQADSNGVTMINPASPMGQVCLRRS